MKKIILTITTFLLIGAFCFSSFAISDKLKNALSQMDGNVAKEIENKIKEKEEKAAVAESKRREQESIEFEKKLLEEASKQQSTEVEETIVVEEETTVVEEETTVVEEETSKVVESVEEKVVEEPEDKEVKTINLGEDLFTIYLNNLPGAKDAKYYEVVTEEAKWKEEYPTHFVTDTDAPDVWVRRLEGVLKDKTFEEIVDEQAHKNVYKENNYVSASILPQRGLMPEYALSNNWYYNDDYYFMQHYTFKSGDDIIKLSLRHKVDEIKIDGTDYAIYLPKNYKDIKDDCNGSVFACQYGKEYNMDKLTLYVYEQNTDAEWIKTLLEDEGYGKVEDADIKKMSDANWSLDAIKEYFIKRYKPLDYGTFKVTTFDDEVLNYAYMGGFEVDSKDMPYNSVIIVDTGDNRIVFDVVENTPWLYNRCAPMYYSSLHKVKKDNVENVNVVETTAVAESIQETTQAVEEMVKEEPINATTIDLGEGLKKYDYNVLFTPIDITDDQKKNGMVKNFKTEKEDYFIEVYNIPKTEEEKNETLESYTKKQAKRYGINDYVINKYKDISYGSYIAYEGGWYENIDLFSNGDVWTKVVLYIEGKEIELGDGIYSYIPKNAKVIALKDGTREIFSCEFNEIDHFANIECYIIAKNFNKFEDGLGIKKELYDALVQDGWTIEEELAFYKLYRKAKEDKAELRNANDVDYVWCDAVNDGIRIVDLVVEGKDDFYNVVISGKEETFCLSADAYARSFHRK